MNELTLSVVIITYNQEKFIGKTLNSIISQNHNYSYEIVIGDDCSKDKTQEIIEDYCKRYPGIIKPEYNKANKGIIKNYFDTITRCKGKYIMDVAGDDWFLQGKIKKQIDFLERNPDVGMCYGYAEQYFEKSKKIGKKKIGGNTNTFDSLIIRNEIPAPTMCVRNSLFKKYFLEENPLKQEWLMEDYPMWLWFSLNSRIEMIKEDFAVYRVQEESASHSKNIEKLLLMEKSANDVRNYFIKKYNKGTPVEFDINKQRAFYYASNFGNSKKEISNELSKSNNLTRKEKVLKRIWSCNLTLFLYRLKYLLKK